MVDATFRDRVVTEKRHTHPAQSAHVRDTPRQR
jgi:hypothetical protein